jgi:hypothetical protein
MGEKSLYILTTVSNQYSSSFSLDSFIAFQLLMVDLASHPTLLVKLRLCDSQHHAPDSYPRERTPVPIK